MPNRGNSNQRGRGGGYRGNSRGGQNNNFRGRGRGRGRGGFNGGLGQSVDLMNSLDFSVNDYPPPPNNNNNNNKPYRGRGRGFNRARGTQTPPRRGRGGIGSPPANFYNQNNARSTPYAYGNTSQKMPSNAPLSHLLYADRPLLKPVIFVRSALTATLFATEEDEEQQLLRAGIEDVDDTERSHVPTADRVMRVFSGIPSTPPVDTEPDGKLEEVDFNDMARFASENLESPAIVATEREEVMEIEEKFTGVVLSSTVQTQEATETLEIEQEVVEVSSEAKADAAPSGNSDEAQPLEETPLFFVDREPAKIEAQPQKASVGPLTSISPLGAKDVEDDEEIIVYDAPNPRSSHVSRAPTPAQPHMERQLESPKVASDPTVAGPSQVKQEEEPLPAKVPRIEEITFQFSEHSSTLSPSSSRVLTPGAKARVKVRQKRLARRANKPKGGFASFGAAFAEAALHPSPLKKDAKKKERRYDSDVEWGTEEEDEDIAVSDGGMKVDEDVDIDVLKKFVNGMGKGWTSMDDIEDERRMKEEDAEVNETPGTSESSDESEIDEEIEGVFDKEEDLLVAEPGAEDDDEDEDEDSEDDVEGSPNEVFFKRLEQLRSRTSTRPSENTEPLESDDEDEDEDVLEGGYGKWEDDDGLFEEFLDLVHGTQQARRLKNGQKKGKKNKGNKPDFKSILNGSFEIDDVDLAELDLAMEEEDEYMFQPAKKGKKKVAHLPLELQLQWEKDRAKKAKYKNERFLSRLEAASDPMAKKKGGKKGRKDMMAAARLPPPSSGENSSISNSLPNRVIDITTLVQQIRRFIMDLSGPQSMSLPPCAKETRQTVHQLALAFGLKSQSKGNGDKRYTTLSKTTRTGVAVNEKKIGRLIRQSGGRGGGGNEFVRGPKGAAGRPVDKPREGELVGKEAPKINQSNVGFRMLASMGWMEGETIGVASGGDALNAPLKAIVKTTKLGLGAVK